MAFVIDDGLLRRLAEVNSFPVPNEGMVFFGLRGSLPLNPDDLDLDAAHQINVENVDYVHPRCTLGQWLPADRLLAVFPGSTVPHSKFIPAAMANGGAGVNQLLTGYYDDYRKGVHKQGSVTAHDAFKQTEGRPIRRTKDDLDFEANDMTEFMNPFDNLHAGWCPSANHTNYESMGCQVVVGFPQCAKRGNLPAAGPWAVFKQNAYELNQNNFGYMLLDGRSVLSVAEAGDSEFPIRLRYGSEGAKVKDLQRKLKSAGFFEGDVDGQFGPRTIRAVLEFQTHTFGFNSEDGVVGQQTASALGFDLGNA